MVIYGQECSWCGRYGCSGYCRNYSSPYSPCYPTPLPGPNYWPMQPHGCVCPVGAEKTCQGAGCPRRAPTVQWTTGGLSPNITGYGISSVTVANLQVYVSNTVSGTSLNVHANTQLLNEYADTSVGGVCASNNISLEDGVYINGRWCSANTAGVWYNPTYQKFEYCPEHADEWYVDGDWQKPTT
jgi:hypothetical protein